MNNTLVTKIVDQPMSETVTPFPPTPLLREWRTWMRAAGMSHRTVTDRMQLVARFARVLGGDVARADWPDIAEFLAGAGGRPATRQTYHAHLRAWYRWLVVMDYRLDDPMTKLKAPRRPRRTPRPVTLVELERILATPMHRRTRVMVLLGAYQGLRVSEIARVRGSDLRFGSLFVLGKGDVEAYVPLHPIIEQIAASMPRTGPWFPSHVKPGHTICGRSVSTMLGDLMRRAGIIGKTPHSLRHFFGTEALRTHGNLAVVQQLLRHADISTTVIYTEVEDTERRRAVESLPLPPSLRDAA